MKNPIRKKRAFSGAERKPVKNFAVCVKFYSQGQMSGKKWEDALSFKCTLVGEYI